MSYPIHFRKAAGGPSVGALLLGCAVVACGAMAAWGQAGVGEAAQRQDAVSHDVQSQDVQTQDAASHDVQSQAGQSQAGESQAGQSQAGQSEQSAGVVAIGLARAQPAPPDRRKVREAESAYLAGAKRLERDDLDAAENEFKRALTLDPGNRDYAIAISVTRQHRVTELVQQTGKARQAGQDARAATLLAEARTIDPDNPIVMEHSGAGFVPGLGAGQAVGTAAAGGPEAQGGGARTVAVTPLADRETLLSVGDAGEPWRIGAPVLAGTLKLEPTPGPQSFHLNADAEEVIRLVTSAYGIRAVFDGSLQHRRVRLDIDDVPYQVAMDVLSSMAQAIAAPLDERTVLIAKDTAESRSRLEHRLEETIYFPSATPERINDLAAVMKNVFDIKQATVEAGLGSIVVQAPEGVFPAMNRTLEDLMDGDGVVMVEMKMYEVDTSRMMNIGGTIPTQVGIYNVEQAATELVNSNQALVQQAIAQGYIASTASPVEIALALIGSGLVQSPMLSSTVGFFGKGLTFTGITATTNTAFKLGLNSTDTRALDDVQVRVNDRQPAVLREGTRYPVTQSTYTTGLSTAASNVGNATINGVSVSSLLSQYAGGSSATIPQVTYEDLGVTLETTPTIQKSGRVNLLLNLKIEAIAGGSSNGIPVLQNRVFKSDITVGDGESAMMVSTVSRTETTAMTGIPGLSELPGFQIPIEENTERDTTQLVVVVTPRVVRRRSDLFAGPRMVVKTEPEGLAAN
jgi:hypothetical protein